MLFECESSGCRVASVTFTEDSLVVALMDGRQISVPLEWYPRLAHATSDQLAVWEICGGGYGIHWPELDEDLSTEDLLRGAPSPFFAEHECSAGAECRSDGGGTNRPFAREARSYAGPGSCRSAPRAQMGQPER
jgi:hypothetical protein